MIPMIWLIDIWLVNWWFMDGWPGWRRELKTAEDFAEETRLAQASQAWRPGMTPGLVAGVVGGLVLYFFMVWLLPICSATFTLVK